MSALFHTFPAFLWLVIIIFNWLALFSYDWPLFEQKNKELFSPTSRSSQFSVGFVNGSSIKAFGDGHFSVQSDGTTLYYMNNLNQGSTGELVVTPSLVEGMGLLHNNCSLRFQMYIGDGGTDFGGFASINIGSGADCLLAATTPRSFLQCAGLGIKFDSQPTGTTASVNIGSTMAVISDDLASIIRGKWTSVQLDFITLNLEQDQRAIVLKLNGESVFPLPISWSKTILNTGGAYVSEDDWSHEINFLANTCTTGSCVDNHIIKNIYYVCGVGEIPSLPLVDPPSPSIVPSPSTTPKFLPSSGEPSPAPARTPEPSNSPFPTHKPFKTLAPTPQATPIQTPVSSQSSSEQLPFCQVPNPWAAPVDHFKLMFDAHKFGHTVVLTDQQQEQFGLGLISPAIARIVGFGEYATNITFNLSLASAANCEGVRFVLDYGAKKSCLYSRSNTQPRIPRPSPEFQPQILPNVLPVTPPNFGEKPIPWPCPPGSCPREDDNNPSSSLQPLSITNPEGAVPSAETIQNPDCDGISLALISGSDAAGVFVAKRNSLIYSGNASMFSHAKTVRIKMEYVPIGAGEYMQFFINDIPITSRIPFSTDDIAQGTRIFPKITFAAATGICPLKHMIDGVHIEMEKEITCSEMEVKLRESATEELPEYLNMMSKQYQSNVQSISTQSKVLNWLAIGSAFLGAAALVLQLSKSTTAADEELDYIQL